MAPIRPFQRLGAIMVHSPVLALLLLSACNGKGAQEDAACTDDLVVTSPNRGAWIEADSVAVLGRSCTLESIQVQGQPVALDEAGSFSVTVPLVRGINTVEIVGLKGDTPVEIERLSVLQGDFGEAGALLEQPLRTHISEAGLGLLSGAVIGMMTPEALTTMVAANNPLVQEPLDLGIVLDTEVHVTTVEFSGATLDLALHDGKVGLSLQVADFHAWGTLLASLDGSGFYDETMDGYADLVVVSGYLSPGLQNGALQLEASEVSARLEGFGFNVSDFPDWIEDHVLDDVVREMIEEIVVETLPEMLIPAMVDAFGLLTLQDTVEFFDASLDLSTQPVAFEVSTLGIDLSFDMAVSGAGGAHAAPHGPFLSPATETSLAQQEDIGIGVHDDVLNSALYELWRAGGFDMALSTTDDSLTSMASTLLESDNVEMGLDFVLPPVVVAGPDGLEFQFGEIVVDLQTPGGILGETATLAIFGTMDVNATFGAGELSLEFEGIDADALVRENDWGMGTLEASDALAQRLPLEMALAMMADMTLPMPNLMEMGLSSVTASRSGETPETVISIR